MQHEFDVLVVGGGPAGMAAAVRAAECGVRVGIVDDNPTFGGQIWRGESTETREAVVWRERFRTAGVTTLNGTRVFHQPRPGILLAEHDEGLRILSCRNLILATGARERFLPFPGWSLPNVMGAGGLQAMVKAGLPVRGKRVVVAGTGPLLLAVAAYLRKCGAEIPIICEQASWSRLGRFSAALLRYPRKIAQALRLKLELAAVPFATGSWPLAAYGKSAVESVTISRGGRSEIVACDYLACGFHLVPNIELPLLLGCQIRAGYVQVGDLQQTSVSGVFCAGEPTGIGGVESSLVEGQIAGLAAGGCAEQAKRLFGARARARRLTSLLDNAFRLRHELRNLPSPETLVCRCEDVSYARLQKQVNWRAAKLQARCGMGPCQGQICGPATQFLFRWNPDSVRPPIFPVRVENLATHVDQPNPQETAILGGP